MILGFGWNIAGAAIAAVIGNVADAMLYIGYFLLKKSNLSIRVKDFTLKDKVCSGVLAIGIPALFVLKAALGLTGLVWAQPVADVLSTVLAVVLYVRTYRGLSVE